MSDSFSISLETAKAMADSFALTTGVRCLLLSARGDILYQHGEPEDECTFLKALPGTPPVCVDLHLRGVTQAENSGGRYIYSCASGLAYCASPIVVGGALAGGLVAGPMLLMEPEDLLEDLAERRQIPGGQTDVLRAFLEGIPRMGSKQMDHLSLQLFADAVCIGDNSSEPLLRQGEEWRQRSIGQYIHETRNSAQNRRYPIEKEYELFDAVARGDRHAANALLNELLGYIFFFSAETDTSQIRVIELLMLLSRAAIQGGGSQDIALAISDQCIQQLRYLQTQEEIARWLAQALRRYTDLVFELVELKHGNIIHKAVSYIRINCERNLTLGEVADYVGYSHTHFSKIFKEEMGCGFRTYLNQARIEKGKVLLLANRVPLCEICTACGFEDQSYFCKVFKRLVGMTPDRYRKQGRRIDAGIERSRR